MLETEILDGEAIRCHIRWMIRRDMPEILQIEKFNVGPVWEEEDFLKTLRQRNCIGMVAEKNDTVIGFMVYELHRQKLEILKMASLAPGETPVLRQLIFKLKSKLSSHRRTRLEFIVPLKNLPLLKLLARENFKAVANYDDYYENYESDGVKMQFNLT